MSRAAREQLRMFAKLAVGLLSQLKKLPIVLVAKAKGHGNADILLFASVSNWGAFLYVACAESKATDHPEYILEMTYQFCSHCRRGSENTQISTFLAIKMVIRKCIPREMLIMSFRHVL